MGRLLAICLLALYVLLWELSPVETPLEVAVVEQEQTQEQSTLESTPCASPLPVIGDLVIEHDPEEFTEEDVLLLAKVIAWEARGEPYEGQVAVGAVVLNRLRHNKFPSTIQQVVFQAYQFSGVSLKNKNFVKLEIPDSCISAAKDAIAGQDPTDGALYYVNLNKVRPYWVDHFTFVKRIGDHWFYKG